MNFYVHLQTSFLKQTVFLRNVSEIIDHYSSIYDNYVILGEVNMELSDSILKTFMQSHNLFNLIISNTCFKGRGFCIDLILILDHRSELI